MMPSHFVTMACPQAEGTVPNFSAVEAALATGPDPWGCGIAS